MRPQSCANNVRARELGLRQWDLFLNLGLLHLERYEITCAAIDALTTAAKLGPTHERRAVF